MLSIGVVKPVLRWGDLLDVGRGQARMGCERGEAEEDLVPCIVGTSLRRGEIDIKKLIVWGHVFFTVRATVRLFDGADETSPPFPFAKLGVPV